ncbi:MAG TPA: CHAT domain-containing protein [Pyrinomonadaceae bacterium]|nr:CHAT domain-containing protein [Pyrinomonadaceae bacterium]
MAKSDQHLERAIEAFEASERSHNINSLNEAISALEDSLAQESLPVFFRSSFINWLSGRLWERFKRIGDLRDLDGCIQRMRDLIEISGPLENLEPAHMHNLGLALETRFQRVLDPRDIDEAIKCHTQAIELGKRRGGVKVIWVNNLANALRNRGHLSRGLSDLQEAIRLHEKVLTQTPIGSEDFVIHRANLANDLLDLYAWSTDTRDIKLLQRANSLLENSGEESGQTPADLVHSLGTLAHALKLKAMDSPHDADLIRQSTSTYRAAVLLGLLHEPTQAMRHAANWGNWAFARSEWAEAVEAFQHALKLAGELFSMQVDRAKKEAWLRETQDIGARIAFSLCELKCPDEAIVVLEGTLARILSLSLATGTEEPAPLPSPSDAKTLSDRFIEAARVGPLVYVCCTLHGGIALVATSEKASQVIALELPALNESFLDSQLRYLLGTYQTGDMRKWLKALEDVTHKFYSGVMEPILAVIGRFSHATLIPVGRLSLIPLHAAWTKPQSAGGGRVYALDNMSLSYAPNAHVMRGFNLEQSRPQSILVVHDSSLEGAGFEASSVALTFPQRTILKGDDTTRSKVLDSIGQNEVAHFCCHGRADPLHPQSNALLMSDGTAITLSDIQAMDAGRIKLAVLSACETNVPGEILPDEAVSFSTGLLEAGIPSVISADWKVPDLPTALLMIHFYYLWRYEEQPATRAFRQAQKWLRDSNNLEKIQRLSDYPGNVIDQNARESLIEHLKDQGRDERSFEHLYYWAGFRWTGVVFVS